MTHMLGAQKIYIVELKCWGRQRLRESFAGGAKHCILRDSAARGRNVCCQVLGPQEPSSMAVSCAPALVSCPALFWVQN